MNHIMEVLPKFSETIDKLESIKRAVVEQSGIDYMSQDARMVALDSLQISISAAGLWIRGMDSLANCFIKSGNFDEKGFLNSVGSGVNIKLTEEIMFDHLRLGLITLAHFKIDNLFHNILKHLNCLPKKMGYWNLTDEILSQCALSKTGTEKEWLTAFANLRNSLHCNGIHKTNSLNIQIAGITFDFNKGERLECVSWSHIIVLLNSNIGILRTILLSPKVVNIKNEIKDDFASGE